MGDRAALEQLLHDAVEQKVEVERSPAGFLVLAEGLAWVKKPKRRPPPRWVFDER